MGISKMKGFRMRRNKKTERTGQLVIDAGCSIFLEIQCGWIFCTIILEVMVIK